MKKCFKYIIHGIGLALAFTIIYILSWTPFFILYGISSLMARLLLKIKRIPTNKIVKRNFRRVYPEKTGSEILELCRKYYATFGDYLVEFVKRIHFTNRTMKKRCQFKNLELLKKKFEEKKGLLEKISDSSLSFAPLLCDWIYFEYFRSCGLESGGDSMERDFYGYFFSACDSICIRFIFAFGGYGISPGVSAASARL